MKRLIVFCLEKKINNIIKYKLHASLCLLVKIEFFVLYRSINLKYNRNNYY